jgi:hypothetical protein
MLEVLKIIAMVWLALVLTYAIFAVILIACRRAAASIRRMWDRRKIK